VHPVFLRRRGTWALARLTVLLGLFVLAHIARAQLPNFAVTARHNIEYGEANGEKLLLDVYTPEQATGPLPAVIMVHGGGWVSGDKSDFKGDGLARYGFVVFSVNYRLANNPADVYPAAYDDVQRSVRWVRAHAAEYNVDPKRVGAFGASAGGHLVALLGTTDTRDNSDPDLAAYSSRVNCVVDLFGPTDFDPTLKASDEAHQIVLKFLGATPEDNPAVYTAASPINHIDAKTVPFLIFHGQDDPLVPVDQSQRFYNALIQNGTEAKLTIFPGEGHGFTKPADNLEMVTEAVRFIVSHLGNR